MRQKNQINCQCFNLSSSDLHLFVRQKETEEKRDLSNSRQQHRTPEVKFESEHKPNKKSLKKRPASHKQSDIVQNSQLEQSNKQISDFHVQPVRVVPLSAGSMVNYRPAQQSVPTRLVQFQPISLKNQTVNLRPVDSHNFHNLHPHQQYFSVQSANRERQTFSFRQPQQIKPQNYHENWTVTQQPPQRVFNIQPKQIQLKQVREKQQSLYEPKTVERLPMTFRHTVEQSSFNHHEPQIDPSELHIDGFSRVIQKRQENVTASPEKVGLRETQNIKKYQKKLFGRLAQSDDDEKPASQHSQVIGKGDDHDFWETQSRHVGKETTISHSTNTKMSVLPKTFQEFNNSNQGALGGLGNRGHFKSYKQL